MTDDDQMPEEILRALRQTQKQLEWARPYLEQARRNAEITESILGPFRQAQLFADQARDAVEMVQSYMPLLEAMRHHRELVRRILPTTGALAAWADQLTRATDAGMGQLAEIGRLPAALTITPQFRYQPRKHTATASLTVVPDFVAHAHFATATAAATDSLAVSVDEDASVEELQRRATNLNATPRSTRLADSPVRTGCSGAAAAGGQGLPD